MRHSILASFSTAAFLLAPPTFAQSPATATPAPKVQTLYGQKLKFSGLPNIGKVDEVLYRGGQPKKDGIAQLKELGITTIVDLREEDPAKISWERQQAESAGMRFVHIPVGGWSAPTTEQVAQFLSLFRENPRPKVFVHCHYGHDRTGVFVAAYRITRDGWSAEQAIQEMDFFGFNGFWHPRMKSYVRDFPVLLKTTPALAKFSGH